MPALRRIGAEEVDFATSCGSAVQKTFKQAVWTLHSFWYPEALKEFTAVTEAEPNCAMGYWGIAMSHWYPLWYPPSPAALKAGSEAVDKAMAAPTKTEREKDYIAAIAAFYRDNDKLDHLTRAVAYEKAMEQVYLKYPEDRESAVFYALALDTTALPTDKTYANQKKAAQILNKVWTEQPNHPGVVHYLIHSDDSAQFAQAGLDAAICYAKIAPDVPHALHMPSHIFTRLGMWQESIDFKPRRSTPLRSPTFERRLGRKRLRHRDRPYHGLSRIRLSADRSGSARPKRSSTSWLHFAKAPERICPRPMPSRRSRCASCSNAATGPRPRRCRRRRSGSRSNASHGPRRWSPLDVRSARAYRQHRGRGGRNRQIAIAQRQARCGQGHVLG